MQTYSQTLLKRIHKRLKALYGRNYNCERLIERLHSMVGRYEVGLDRQSSSLVKHWTEKDAILITYADMVQDGDSIPLAVLKDFCEDHLEGAISTVHLLPFYPWSSDDGFSVIDYREVKEEYGKWFHVRAFKHKFDLMFDLVLNHCSRQSPWFKDFVIGTEPAHNYFIEEDPKLDLSKVVRPRTSPVLTKMHTRKGVTHVWTTFSADQVDLNWKNPDVLFDFLDILFAYIAHGVRFVRLDAVAFLWKEIGTTCIHLPQTHEVVKLFRDVLDMVAPHVVLITETNVPQDENFSYFGSGDETHMVYNFPLPPLLLHGFLKGSAKYLTQWANNLPPLPKGCTYFNFAASHDGIGVRALKGLVPDEDLDFVVNEVKERGGKISMRSMADGSESPYELNITYFDAMQDLGNPELTINRFMCSQAVLMALQGIPGIYFHSLVATPNYQQGVEESGHARRINRMKWDRPEIEALIANKNSDQHIVLEQYTRWLRLRSRHKSFHPDAGQQVYDAGDNIFAFKRIATDHKESILCVFNFTDEIEVLKKIDETLSLGHMTSARDILSNQNIDLSGHQLTLQPYQALWLIVS